MIVKLGMMMIGLGQKNYADDFFKHESEEAIEEDKNEHSMLIKNDENQEEEED